MTDGCRQPTNQIKKNWIMDIREKARELGKVYARQYRHNNPDVSGDGFVFSDAEIEQACNKMGEAVLEAVCDWLDRMNITEFYVEDGRVRNDWLVEDLKNSFETLPASL